jgi:hypothetical protein
MRAWYIFSVLYRISTQSSVFVERKKRTNHVVKLSIFSIFQGLCFSYSCIFTIDKSSVRHYPYDGCTHWQFTWIDHGKRPCIILLIFPLDCSFKAVFDMLVHWRGSPRGESVFSYSLGNFPLVPHKDLITMMFPCPPSLHVPLFPIRIYLSILVPVFSLQNTPCSLRDPHWRTNHD